MCKISIRSHLIIIISAIMRSPVLSELKKQQRSRTSSSLQIISNFNGLSRDFRDHQHRHKLRQIEFHDSFQERIPLTRRDLACKFTKFTNLPPLIVNKRETIKSSSMEVDEFENAMPPTTEAEMFRLHDDFLHGDSSRTPIELG